MADQDPRETRFRFDGRVSLGNLLTIITISIPVAIAASQLHTASVVNSAQINALQVSAVKLEQLVAENKQWQVKQRIRVWDDNKDIRKEQQKFRDALTTIQANQKHILEAVRRGG